MTSIEKDLIAMQERIAWLEAANDNLVNRVGMLYDHIDTLERKIQILSSKSSGESAVRPLSEETPPPHY
ncbi:SlyX [Anaerobiospirillum thomasii]|uniref:SlyX family protein n=1 Tax=Anaerobiospirillum thomasii TaxID=179995 RepID=UPI000D878F7B|nr:SlyX family protein [Anaerobiospirillum thomasii]SPT67825.1 SlyX [Anaerobiospirillum thomasii]